MMKKVIFFIIFVFLSASYFVMAETLQLSLNEAIGLGLKNSTTLKIKMLATYSARAGVQSAKSAYYPSVEIGATYRHLFKEQKILGSYVAGSDPVSISTDVGQTIYTFGKLKNAARLAEENLTLTEMDFEEEKRKLIIEIKRVFYWYILAEEVLAVQEETLKYKEEALDVAQKRYKAGLAPEYEVLSAESDVENFRPELISAANQVEFALLAVKDLLGVVDEGDFDVELIGSLEPEYFIFTKGKLFEEALKNKYEVKQYKKSISLMEINEAITKGGKKPVIAGFANYTLQSGFDSETGDARYWGKDSWEGNLMCGVRIQMPLSALFPWSKENADVKKDALDLEQLKLGLSSIESGIRLNIENILLQLEEEKAKISSGEKGVELALKLYASASERYVNGLISSMELKDTQITLNAAQLGSLTSIYNYKSALFDLMDAVGVDHF